MFVSKRILFVCIQEANRALSELEQQRQLAVHSEQRAQQELRQLQERLGGTNTAQYIMKYP